MVWDRALEDAVRNDDVNLFRVLLGKGSDPCGHDIEGNTLWALANEHSSACYRILCGARPKETARYRYAQYLPEHDKFLFRFNSNHRVGLLLLLHPTLLRLLNLRLARKDAWGEHCFYKTGSYSCTTLLALFMPLKDLRKLDASFRHLDGRAIAIVAGTGALDLFVVHHDDNASRILHAGLACTAMEAGDEDGKPEAIALLGTAMDRADAALQTAARPLEAPVHCFTNASTDSKRRRHAWRMGFQWTIMYGQDCAEREEQDMQLGQEQVPVRLAAGVRVIAVSEQIPDAWVEAMGGKEVHHVYRGDRLLLAPGQVVALTDDGQIRVTPGGHGAGFYMGNDGPERLAIRTHLGR